MARTDWTSKDTVRPADMNQIGQEINDLESSATVWLGVTEGTDTEYTVTSNKVSSLYESLRVSFRAHQTSGTNPTLQINSLGAIPLKKPNGRAAKLDTDGVYTAVYSAASFILQGEGGEYGTATAADVLAPKSIGTDNGIVTGTMPTQGDQFKSGSWINPDGDSYVDTYVDVDGGYYPPGTQVTIQAYDPNLVSNNIRADAKVFGVDGDPNVIDTYMDDGYAAVNDDLLENKRAFVNGKMLYGGIKNYKNIHFGGQLVPKSGANIGVMPTRTGLMDVTTELNVPMPNKLPENIRAGVDIGGTVGTAGSIKRVVRGNTTIEAQVSNRDTVDISSFGLNQGSTLLYFTVRTAEFYPHKYRVQGVPIGSDPFPSSPLNRIDFFVDYAGSIKYIEFQLVEYDGVKRRIAGYTSRDTGSNPAIVNLSPAVTDMSKCILVGSYSTNETTGGNYDPLLRFGNVSQLLLYGSTTPGFHEQWYYQLIEFY
ncbi:hypothetical protein P4H67_25910 [Paenibacillus lautus]|uniref:hypothetical protein n=1 Tax=Paenibacillus lautus TaxID=1401 RepID=UPI002DBF898E|nr:hypothetical protein [Paenibacillus lautus]MEC0310195.1 hypothetical protein [Paenibacillus lautus]